MSVVFPNGVDSVATDKSSGQEVVLEEHITGDVIGVHPVQDYDVFEKRIDLHDSEQSTLSYIRRAKDQSDVVVCVFNFSPVPRHGFRLGVPMAGWY